MTPMIAMQTTDPTMSYVAGIRGLISPSVFAASKECVVIAISEDEAGDEADQRERLGERDTEEHVGADRALPLRLTSDALDRLTDDDADADARADGCQTVADGAEALERLRGVGGILGQVREAHEFHFPFCCSPAGRRDVAG